jgi:transcriptional pleiotropic regulator of transition state genes
MKGRNQNMAKATGVARRVDQLGRIVIPKELRDVMGISSEDSLEVFVDGNQIILRKYERGCTLCGDMENIQYFKGRMVCRQCVDVMNLQVAK